MDEYTADPAETEREAQEKLKKIKFNQARAEVSKIAEEVNAEKSRANQYTKSYNGNTRAGGSAGGSGAGDLDFVGMGIRKPKPTYKKGGTVKSASSRADGIAIRGKTRA
jgi:hypothetical protein